MRRTCAPPKVSTARALVRRPTRMKEFVVVVVVAARSACNNLARKICAAKATKQTHKHTNSKDAKCHSSGLIRSLQWLCISLSTMSLCSSRRCNHTKGRGCCIELARHIGAELAQSFSFRPSPLARARLRKVSLEIF